MNSEIFVFGSNLAGRHGAGAAKFAHEKLGAVMGVGEGLTGHTYAIPTKDAQIQMMDWDEIREHVHKFVTFAHDHPELTFKVTQIGCGLAGWRREQIAPLFVNAPDNCMFDSEWWVILGDKKKYWGSVSANPNEKCVE